MAELKELKLEQLQKALATLAVALNEQETDIVRDAAIQRFEYSVELFWKASRIVLTIHGLEANSPKGAIRELRNIKVFDDVETEIALKMIDDRNLSVHTYKKELAEELYGRLPGYLALMQKALEKFPNT